MKAAGWSLKWDDKLTECFVFPEALQRFNNKSAIMNIEYFVERKCIEKHVDENPCLTAEVGSLISQLKVAGWKMIDVPKKEGEEAYKIFSYGVDNAIPGLQMFYNTASLKKFIHRQAVNMLFAYSLNLCAVAMLDINSYDKMSL